MPLKGWKAMTDDERAAYVRAGHALTKEQFEYGTQHGSEELRCALQERIIARLGTLFGTLPVFHFNSLLPTFGLPQEVIKGLLDFNNQMEQVGRNIMQALKGVEMVSPGQATYEALAQYARRVEDQLAGVSLP